MLSPELLRKVKQIEIKSRFLASEVFSGEYETAFRGSGMEFEEVREYQPGDEIRSIDWNVTARTGQPYVKLFREEREQSVVFLVDASASQNFGTAEKLKKEIAAEIAALLAYAALRSHDKIGLLIFTDQIERYIPPKKGRGHVWEVVREILSFEPKHRRTDLKKAFEFLLTVLKRRMVCFVLSDFLDQGFDQAFGSFARRHDTIALRLQDPLEKEIPNLGWVYFEDAETSESGWIQTSGLFKTRFSLQREQSKDALTAKFQGLGIDVCEIKTDQDYVEALMKLFRLRDKRR